MNIGGCANCELHGWNQVEDLATLQRCKRCKVIQYCGRDCQKEHWLKIHHKHCKYFADPAKVQQWDHREENCVICRQSAVVGKAQLKRPENPNYECIFEEVKKGPPNMYHPNPFSITGHPGDTLEKGIIVLWQLMKKFQLTQPGVVRNCLKEIVDVFFQLKIMRLRILRVRKISPQSEIQRIGILYLDLRAAEEKVKTSEPTAEPFKLFDIILLVHKKLFDVHILEYLKVLINPLSDIPAELHAIVSQAVNNSAKFLATVNQVLDSLTKQVIPFRDVLTIICNGSLEQACAFCFKKIIVANVNYIGPKGPIVMFNCLYAGIYCCEGYNCLEKLHSFKTDQSRFFAIMMSAVKERISTRCDFCLKLTPRADVHRCSKCLAVMYCGTNCQNQDFKIHKEFCKEDVEGRKKKSEGSARRKEAKEALEEFEKIIEGIDIREEDKQEAFEVLSKFKLKKSSNKSK